MPRWISIEEAKAKGKAPWAPSILKHCAVAVRKKGKSAAAAWAICRAQLTKQGYIRGPYRPKGKVIRLTKKGADRSAHHTLEPKHDGKARRFDRDFRGVGG